jgi:hypothetical protein
MKEKVAGERGGGGWGAEVVGRCNKGADMFDRGNTNPETQLQHRLQITGATLNIGHKL